MILILRTMTFDRRGDCNVTRGERRSREGCVNSLCIEMYEFGLS